MLKNLRQSYSALNDLSFAPSPLLSEELIVKDESDNELIWQQISMQNKAVFKEVRKTLKLFGDDLKIPEEGGIDDSEVEDNQMEDEEELEDDDDEFEEVEEDQPPRKKTKGVDLFNIRLVFLIMF
jgi:Rieske Fe-S protein